MIEARNSVVPDQPAERIGLRWLSRFACLTTACFAFVLLSLALTRFTHVPPIMPMTGIAMAGMLLWGKRMWPAVPVSVLLALAVLRFPGSIPLQIIVAFSLAIGPFAGVLVIERMIGRLELPARAEHAIPSILGAATCSVLMATGVALPIALHGQLGGAALGLMVVQHAIRQLTGALLTLPLVLAWADARPRAWKLGHWLYLATILLVTAAISYLVFFDTRSMPIAWAVYPPLIWAGIAFRMRGTTAAVLIISGAAFASEALGVGIFAREPKDPLSLMLTFVSVTSGTMLIFAALAHERLTERRMRLQVSDAKHALEIAEAEAVHANTQLRLSQEAAGAIAWEYDIQAARLVRVFGDSEAVDIMTGHHPVGGNAAEMTGGSLAIVTEAMRMAVNTESELDVTLRAGAVDHPTRWLRVVGRYDGTNNRRRLVGMTLDVTQLHEARASAQAANEKLLGISRLSAMGAMASTLAHELNQPLTAVANYAATARMLLSSNIPDAAEMATQHLNQLVEASLRAGKIIRKMRDFTISGEITHTVEDLGDIVRSAWSYVRERPAAAGATLEFEAAAGRTIVAVDRLQIEQVLVNLLLNAVEATTGQDLRHVTVRIVTGPVTVSVSVVDNGGGVPDDVIDTLFEPFCTTKPDGTGLGLPICRTIVEAHGGKIWVEDRAGRGAEFVFTIASDAGVP